MLVITHTNKRYYFLIMLTIGVCGKERRFCIPLLVLFDRQYHIGRRQKKSHISILGSSNLSLLSNHLLGPNELMINIEPGETTSWKETFWKNYLPQSCYSYDISCEYCKGKRKLCKFSTLKKPKKTPTTRKTVLHILLLIAWNFAGCGFKN